MIRFKGGGRGFAELALLLNINNAIILLSSDMDIRILTY
jgi:hypothetical protein